MIKPDYDDTLMVEQAIREDNDASYWITQLSPYRLAKSTIICPSDSVLDFASGSVDHSKSFASLFGSSYDYNVNYGAKYYRTLASAPNPSRLMLFTEYEPFHDGHDFLRGQVAHLFYDGHTGFVRWSGRMNFRWPEVQ